jgi:hypothetical protein
MLFRTGFLLSLLVVISNSSILAEELKLIKEKSITANPGEKLYVEASGANIKVEGWDKNEVYVKIFGNKRAAEKMEFKIDQLSEGVRVEAKRKSSWLFNWGGGYSVRIEVMVPQQYNNFLETSGGNINLKNVDGKMIVETSGGGCLFKQYKRRIEG